LSAKRAPKNGPVVPKGGSKPKGGSTLEKYAPRRSGRYLLRFWSPFWPKRGVKTRERARGRKGRKTLRKNATQKRPPGRGGGPKATISPRVFGPFRTGPPRGPNGPKRRPFASVKYCKKCKLAKTTKNGPPQKGALLPSKFPRARPQARAEKTPKMYHSHANPNDLLERPPLSRKNTSFVLCPFGPLGPTGRPKAAIFLAFLTVRAKRGAFP